MLHRICPYDTWKGKYMAVGLVSGIYLQTGIDVKKLKAALRWIKKLSVADHYPVYGSFFLPSKRCISQNLPYTEIIVSEEVKPATAREGLEQRELSKEIAWHLPQSRLRASWVLRKLSCSFQKKLTAPQYRQVLHTSHYRIG